MKLLKNLVALIGATAIGSACWDFFIKDLLIYLTSLFVKIMSNVFNGYIDLIYKDFANAVNIYLAFPTIFIFTVLFLIYYFLFFRFLTRLKKLKVNQKITDQEIDNKNEKTKKIKRNSINLWINKNPKIIYIIILCLLISNSIILFDMIARQTIKYSDKNCMDLNLVILKPYISNIEYDKVNSELNQIDNYLDFVKLKNKMSAIGEKEKVKLKKFIFE